MAVEETIKKKNMVEDENGGEKRMRRNRKRE